MTSSLLYKLWTAEILQDVELKDVIVGKIYTLTKDLKHYQNKPPKIVCPDPWVLFVILRQKIKYLMTYDISLVLNNWLLVIYLQIENLINDIKTTY